MDLLPGGGVLHMPERTSRRTDVLIVGSGAVGVAAGLEAHDPVCQRPLKGRKKIAVPPFYALHYVPLARKNFGGVKTNLRCQVLDKHYEPIPGLYAAGELTGMAGGHINGKAGLEGTMLGPALFSGRVAGA